MKKLPDYLDNQIDNILIKIVDATVDIFYYAGFNPNGVTTLSLIFGILAIYLLKKNKYIESATCYLISYFFDCMDGFMARKYNLTTRFGDYYDHIKDTIIFALLFAVFYLKLKDTSGWKKYIPFIISPLIMTTGIHFGCQEIYYNNGVDSDSLDFTKSFCPAKTKNEAKKILYLTKYFSSGSLIVAICLLIVCCEYILPK